MRKLKLAKSKMVRVLGTERNGTRIHFWYLEVSPFVHSLAVLGGVFCVKGTFCCSVWLAKHTQFCATWFS